MSRSFKFNYKGQAMGKMEKHPKVRKDNYSNHPNTGHVRFSNGWFFT